MRHALIAVPVPLGQSFTYSVPEHLAGEVTPGARVLCEFGRRKVIGVVLDVGDGPVDVPAEKLKPVRSVVDSAPVIPEELLGFLVELARYYLAPVGEVMRLALPAVERSASRDSGQRELLDAAKATTVGRLVQVATAVDGATTSEPLKGQATSVLEALRRRGPAPVAELTKEFGNARAAVKRLEKLGLARLSKEAVERDPFFSVAAEPDVPPELTKAQGDAVLAIDARLEGGERGAFLLHGVTGSGKTEVYLRVVQKTVERGGGAIILVPEIALTPQLVARFRARLGDAIAVLHSGLGAADRHAMWKSLRSGKLRVAVGARSALFAPVDALRIICVDEEHDTSFKQEEGVRYNARDMALLRAHRAGAVCVVGSATPSLSSEHLVRTERMTRLSLPERATKRTAMPTVELVDLRRVGPGPGGDRLLSLPLHRALERVLDAKEQAILFLNRRGFAPSLVCDECGALAECPNCSVALTLHRSRGDRLVCHYCDHSEPMPAKCPSCGHDDLVREGAGTERIESALVAAFPTARVARLDRDVAAGLKSEKVLDRMRRGDVDILVGTQMVTKGHDLPSVTLVGVLNADAALSMPDYQAAERTFQLIVQVAGRAGRGDAPGTVLIQTRNPSHPAIALSIQHDVDSFVERELADRRELAYPPFRRLALVRVDAIEEARAARAATELARRARDAAPPGVEVVGPAPAPIARLRNRYRFRFMVRSAERPAMRRALVAVARAPADRRVRVAIDVDPVSML